MKTLLTYKKLLLSFTMILATGLLGWIAFASNPWRFDFKPVRAARGQQALGPQARLQTGEAVASLQPQQTPIDLTRRNAGSAQTFAELIAKAQTDGSVRVIVGLRASFLPEGTLENLAQVQTQRLSIAQAQDALLSQMTAFNVTGIKQFRTIPFLALEVDAAGLQYLQSAPEVTSIQEDVLQPLSLAESVPLIGAPAAWAAGYTGAGQTVAIIDTGVDKTHPFLTGKVVSEACYSTTGTGVTSTCPGGVSQTTEAGSGVNCDAPGCEHGTHVAGIAAGKGSSFSGVAREANIIAIKVATRQNGCTTGNCVGLSDSDILRGLERVYELRSSYSIAAVNMSLGGGKFITNCDASQTAYKMAIDNLRSVGIATIVATGNEGFTGSLAAPACVSSAISVGSTGDGSTANGSTATVDVVVSSSNSASFLHLLAPGRWINSSVPGGGFNNFSGTSMAAPHVAGAWAVLKSKSPNASVAQILMALQGTGLPITDARNGITKPRIRVDAAANALATTACSYTITPTTQSFPVSGGTGTVNVTTGAGCAWTASSNVAWLTLASGSSGSGNGTVNYSVAANTGLERTGTLFVAGQTFVVTQTGVTSLAVDDGTFETFSGIGVGGSSYRVNRLTPTSYPATINAVAIYLPSGAGLNVGSSLTILAAANPSGSATIDGLPFSTTSTTIQALDQFNIFLVPGITINSGDFVVGMQISHPAGAFPFAIDTTPPLRNRSYRSTDGTTFVTIDSIGTPGNYGIRALPTQSLSCPTVASISPASGIVGSTVTITGTGFTSVTAVRFANNQAAQFTVNSDTSITATVPLTAVTGRITLTKANSNCADVPTNVFTVTPCIALTPTSQSFPAAGGTGTVTLTAVSAQCPWTATSNASWLTITAGSSGTGSGAVNFSVAANTGAVTRTGTLTIAGQTFTVTQTSDCHSVTSLAPTSGQAGATVTITGVNLTNVSAVRFLNNVAATFTVVSPTQLTTTVPVGAVSGPITLSKPGCPDVPTSTFTVTAPNLAAAETTLTAESCTPANTAIDPGETVTMNLALRNTGNGNTTNLVATLQATGGVTAPSNPQTYGVLTAGGAAVARPFTFTATGSCGNRLTATLSLQDGAVNRGTVTFSFVLGVPKVSLTENFDSVTAPALPSGWLTAVATGTAPPWVTSSAGDTAPNSVFASDPSSVSDVRLDSPSLAITSATAQLTFRNSYSTEADYDGGVLEIALGSGAFTDILTAGGSFVTGGYNGTIGGSSNPIAGRQAWSGNSGGYLTSVVNLPVAAAGQTIKLRWRMVTDASVGGTGWLIDTIRLTDGATCATSCTSCPTISLTPAALPAGTVNTAYSQTFTASGGTSPYTFALSAGTLPNGLTLSSAGVLSGTPTQSGNFSITVKATDASSGACMGTQTYPLVINCPTITLSPTSLPNGTVNTAYNQTITASPSGTYTFAVTAGTLPAGLSLNVSTGALIGTPTTAGTATFTITATGAAGCTGSQAYSLLLTSCTYIIAPTTQSFGSTGGTGTVTITTGSTCVWVATTDVAWIEITTSKSGVGNDTLGYKVNPNTAGTRTGRITIADKTLIITQTGPCPAITLAPATLPGGTVNTAYNQTLTASGGTASYSFAVTSGALPGGLTLAAGGALSGTPSAAGTFTFTVTATDANNCTGTRSYTIIIQTIPCLPVTVSLPSLTGVPGSALTVPVMVGDLTGRNVTAYDFTLTFDPAVLRLQTPAFDTAGTLSSGFTITPNTSMPGRLTVSAFGTTALTGAGTLLNLKFDLIGAASSCSDLAWASFRFNESLPCATPGNGRVCLTGGAIAGTVNYAITPKPIPGVLLRAAGTPSAMSTTNSSGSYNLIGLGGGPYTVTPTKTGDVNGITSSDASLVAQYVAGLITLTSAQQIAADASGDGTLASYDASLIAQTVVGITNPGIAGTWKFVPGSRSYPTLSGNQTNQNFDAVLVGDVSGNWAPASVPSPLLTLFQARPVWEALLEPVPVALSTTLTGASGATVSVPIQVADVTSSGLVAYDFVLTFDPNVMQLESAPIDVASTLSSGLTITPNAATPGQLRVSAFGTTALSGAGTLLKLNFRVVGAVGTSTPLTWQAFHFNEGTAAMTPGRFAVSEPAPTRTVRTLRSSQRRAVPARNTVPPVRPQER